MNIQNADQFFSSSKLGENLGGSLMDEGKKEELFQKLNELQLDNFSTQSKMKTLLFPFLALGAAVAVVGVGLITLNTNSLKDYDGNNAAKNTPETETPTDTEPTQLPGNELPEGAKITLTGAKTSTGIKLTWSLTNLDAPDGIKVLKGATEALDFPANVVALVEPGKSEYSLNVMDGKNYFFKVCRYKNEGCDVESEVVKVTAPTKPAPPPPVKGTTTTSTGITLSKVEGSTVKWSTSLSAPQGYKLVWSKAANPTYPKREGDYAQYIEPGAAKSYTIPNWEGAATYYVRVCIYKDGTCTPYSNQVTVTVAAKE